jgi:hypothetical protein
MRDRRSPTLAAPRCRSRRFHEPRDGRRAACPRVCKSSEARMSSAGDWAVGTRSEAAQSESSAVVCVGGWQKPNSLLARGRHRLDHSASVSERRVSRFCCRVLLAVSTSMNVGIAVKAAVGAGCAFPNRSPDASRLRACACWRDYLVVTLDPGRGEKVRSHRDDCRIPVW